MTESTDDDNKVGSVLTELGNKAESSLRIMRDKFRADVARQGGPVGWLRFHAPELAAGVIPDLSEEEFFANFEEDYRDGAVRLAQCAGCPKTGGKCAGGYRPGYFPEWSGQKLQWKGCGERWHTHMVTSLAIKCGVAPHQATALPGPGWDLEAIGDWTRGVVSKTSDPWLVLKASEMSSVARVCAAIVRRMCHYWGPDTRYPPAWHRNVCAIEPKVSAQLESGMDPFESDDLLNAGVIVLLGWEPDIDRRVQKALDRLLYKRYSNGQPYAVIASTTDARTMFSKFRQCSEFSGSSVIISRSREL
jgi:hypothetical protein